ncbi:MAG TPA: hypothetical protein VER79_06200 [Candidatus Limnocylindrales bacterium]|nr:hypothetical protein [Candidatus Limnocylindrales bacterium]
MQFWATLQSGLHRLSSPTLGADPADPVLAYVLRRQPWARRPGAWKQGALAFAVAAVVTVALLAFAALAGRALIDPVLLLIVALRLGFDLMALLDTLGRLGPEFASGRWDALRLTAQTEGVMLRAQDAAAQARIWRPLWAALGAQTCGLLLAGAWLSVQPLAGDAAGTLVSAAILALLLALELLLRVRAVHAVGLALSASAPRAGIAALFGALALLPIWLVQLAILLLGLMAAAASASLLDASVGDVVSGLLLLALPLLLVMASHGFVRQAALHRLANAVAERDLTV